MTMTSEAPPAPDPVMELCGSSPVTCLAFGEMTKAEEKSTLFSGHQDGKVLCWNLKSQRRLTCLDGHAEAVLWVSSPKVDILMTQGREGVIKIWASVQSSWKVLGTISTAAFIFCNSAILNLTDHYLLFAPAEPSGTASVHRLLSDFVLDCGQRPQTLTPMHQREQGMCMKMCAFEEKDNAPRLLVAYESGSLILWDVGRRLVLRTVQAHSESVMCLDAASTKEPHKYRVVTGSVDSELKSWIVAHDTLSLDRTVTLTNPGASGLASRGDGRIVAVGGWDGLCRVYAAAKLRPLAVLSHHKESVQCVVFSPDNRLAAGSKDGYITLWDVYVDK